MPTVLYSVGREVRGGSCSQCAPKLWALGSANGAWRECVVRWTVRQSDVERLALRVVERQSVAVT